MTFIVGQLMLDLEQLMAESKRNKILDEIKSNWFRLDTLEQTPDEIETALATSPFAIGLVREATQEMMMRCLDDDINCWVYIKNPTDNVINRVKEHFNCDDEWIKHQQWF